MTGAVTLVNSSITNICGIATFTKYGMFNQRIFQVIYLCVRMHRNYIKLMQLPDIYHFGYCSAISKTSDTTVAISGTGFSAYSGWSLLFFKFAGIKADSVSVRSDTSDPATFTNGIPLTIATAGVKINFVSKKIQLLSSNG
jgi:hypothetical protein